MLHAKLSASEEKKRKLRIRFPLFCNGLSRQSAGFTGSDTENRQRPFDDLFDVVWAGVSPNDSSKGHQDQTHMDIEGDLVGAHFESPLFESRDEVFTQVAIDLTSQGSRMIDESQNGATPCRVVLGSTQNAKRREREASGRVLVGCLDGGFRRQREERVCRQRVDQLCPIGEVVIEGAVGDLSPGHDIADREGVSLFGEDGHSRRKQLQAGSLSLLVASRRPRFDLLIFHGRIESINGEFVNIDKSPNCDVTLILH